MRGFAAGQGCSRGAGRGTRQGPPCRRDPAHGSTAGGHGRHQGHGDTAVVAPLVSASAGRQHQGARRCSQMGKSFPRSIGHRSPLPTGVLQLLFPPRAQGQARGSVILDLLSSLWCLPFPRERRHSSSVLLQFHKNIHKYISISLTESKAAQAPIKHTVTSPPGAPCTGRRKHIKGGGGLERTRLQVKQGYSAAQTLARVQGADGGTCWTPGFRTCAFSGGSLWSTAGCPSEEPHVAPSPPCSPWLLRRCWVLQGRRRKEGAEGSCSCLSPAPWLWLKVWEGTAGLLLQ